MIENKSLSLFSNTNGESQPQEPHFGPGGGLQKQWQLKVHAVEGCGEGGICVGLGRQRVLCFRAQVGKYVRQALGCTRPPRGCTPNAFCLGKKRKHCVCWQPSKRNIPVVLLF